MNYTSRVTSVTPPEVEIRQAGPGGKPGKLVRRITGRDARYYLASLDLDHCRAILSGFGLHQPLAAQDFIDADRAYLNAVRAVDAMRRNMPDPNDFDPYTYDALLAMDGDLKQEWENWKILHNINSRALAICARAQALGVDHLPGPALLRGTTYAALYAVPGLGHDGVDFVVTTSGGWIVRTFTDYAEAESVYLAGIDQNDEHTVQVDEIAKNGLWQG